MAAKRKLKPVKPFLEQVAEYKQLFEPVARKRWVRENPNDKSEPLHQENYYVKSSWNWDESWDGLLIQRCEKLIEAGFEISSFLRKMKIFFRTPQDMPRDEVIRKIMQAVGDDWTGIAFKPRPSIWWGATNKRPYYY